MTATTLAPCGTDAAYQRHYKRGEEIDDACRRASQARLRAKYLKAKALAAAGQLPPCTACGAARTIPGARTWCNACHCRWLYAGRPDGDPPPPKTGKRASQHLRAEFAWLRYADETVEMAGVRLGIHRKTAGLYERARKAGAR